MKNVNITDMREKLSDYVSYVLSGGTIILWRQRKRIAKIIPFRSEKPSESDSEFVALQAQGLVRLPEDVGLPELLAGCPGAPSTPADLGALVTADRAER